MYNDYYGLLKLYRSLLVKNAELQAENTDLLNKLYLLEHTNGDKYRKVTIKLVK